MRHRRVIRELERERERDRQRERENESAGDRVAKSTFLSVNKILR